MNEWVHRVYVRHLVARAAARTSPLARRVLLAAVAIVALGSSCSVLNQRVGDDGSTGSCRPPGSFGGSARCGSNAYCTEPPSSRCAPFCDARDRCPSGGTCTHVINHFGVGGRVCL
jgi:hypothetical protein